MAAALSVRQSGAGASVRCNPSVKVTTSVFMILTAPVLCLATTTVKLG